MVETLPCPCSSSADLSSLMNQGGCGIEGHTLTLIRTVSALHIGDINYYFPHRHRVGEEKGEVLQGSGSLNNYIRQELTPHTHSLALLWPAVFGLPALIGSVHLTGPVAVCVSVRVRVIVYVGVYMHSASQWTLFSSRECSIRGRDCRSTKRFSHPQYSNIPLSSCSVIISSIHLMLM